MCRNGVLIPANQTGYSQVTQDRGPVPRGSRPAWATGPTPSDGLDHPTSPVGQTGPMDSEETTATGDELMHIGVVAERTGLSQRTLRHYDDIGLVSPSQRSEGGFRQYTESDLQRLLLIRRMKPLEFTLQQMQDLLDLTDAVLSGEVTDADLERLREVEAEAAQRRADLTRKVEMADEFLERLGAVSARATEARPDSTV